MRVELVNATESPMGRDEIQKLMTCCLTSIPRSFRGVLAISVVDSRTIRNINRRFRGMDDPTNILTVPLKSFGRDGFVAPQNSSCEYVGEIFLSPREIQASAKERGLSFREEFRFLIIHGFLHLLGWPSKLQSERLEMSALEQELFRVCP